MITEPVPLDSLLREFAFELFALCGAVGLEGTRAFEAQQRKANTSFRERAHVRQHLRLSERLEHSVVGNEKDSPPFKPLFRPHCPPPPSVSAARETRPTKATECCRRSPPRSEEHTSELQSRGL